MNSRSSLLQRHCEVPGALDDLREAVGVLEETVRTASRGWRLDGAMHPFSRRSCSGRDGARGPCKARKRRSAPAKTAEDVCSADIKSYRPGDGWLPKFNQ